MELPVVFELADCLIDGNTLTIRRNKQEFRLEPKTLAVIRYLAERPGQLVSNDELMDAVWSGAIVTPNAVARVVAQARKTLGDDARNPRYIETVSRTGYRCIARSEIQPPVEPPQSHTPVLTESADSGRKLHLVAAAALALVLGYFVLDQFILDSEDASTASQVDSQQPAYPDSDRPENSIAVLPFVNMSSDKEQEYFSDGLSEELLNLLARIPELNVAARTSSFSFKGKNLQIPEIGARLNVAHVLEGSVRKHGNQLRITAQLIQADNGYHLWSETYDRQLDNIFQIQEEIAVEVVDALKINLLSGAPKLRKTDPAAYQLFLEGQYLKRQLSSEALHRAIEAFREVVEIDPAYAPAWAEMADTYMWIGASDTYSYEEITELSDQATQAAINADPDYAFAYYVRGVFFTFRKKKFNRGMDDFQHALELDPDNAFLVAAIGKGAFLTRKYDLAIAQYLKALAMEPVVPEFHFFLGSTYLSAGRLDEAESSFRKMISLSPTSSFGHQLLWKTLYLKGDLEAALAETDNDFTLAVTHFEMGNIEEADEALANLINNRAFYELAMVYGYRLDPDKAFEWLDKLLEDQDYFPTFILTETAFESLHTDERWLRYLERIDLAQYWLDRPPA